jgi:hypothetical protein
MRLLRKVQTQELASTETGACINVFSGSAQQVTKAHDHLSQIAVSLRYGSSKLMKPTIEMSDSDTEEAPGIDTIFLRGQASSSMQLARPFRGLCISIRTDLPFAGR